MNDFKDWAFKIVIILPYSSKRHGTLCADTSQVPFWEKAEFENREYFATVKIKVGGVGGEEGQGWLKCELPFLWLEH